MDRNEPTETRHEVQGQQPDELADSPAQLESDEATDIRVEPQSLVSDTDQVERVGGMQQPRESSHRDKLEDGTGKPADADVSGGEEDEEGSVRERLKRLKREVAGRVWIPDIWGQEELLKDWIDCTSFDACLASSHINSAVAALMEEGRRASSGRLRIENSC